MQKRDDRIYAEIDINAIKRNLRYYKGKNGKKVIAVVKASGYGLGEEIIKYIISEIDGLGVATVEEGIRIRKLYPDIFILVFGYVPISALSLVKENNLSISIYSQSQATKINEYAEKHGIVITANIKINTGMNRLGFSSKNADFVDILSLKNIRINGIYSHYATTNYSDENFVKKQTEEFAKAVDLIKDKVSLSYVHIANSALSHFAVYGNAFRIGYGLYGYGDERLQSCLTLRARLVEIIPVKKGESVGYERVFFAYRDSKIYTLAFGYGDGYPRTSAFRYVIYKGEFLPIIGNICMDMTMVDGTGTDAKIGDYFTLIGTDGDKTIIPDDIGFGYEIITSLSNRVKRYYIE